jgi:hypothetical protein
VKIPRLAPNSHIAALSPFSCPLISLQPSMATGQRVAASQGAGPLGEQSVSCTSARICRLQSPAPACCTTTLHCRRPCAPTWPGSLVCVKLVLNLVSFHICVPIFASSFLLDLTYSIVPRTQI